CALTLKLDEPIVLPGDDSPTLPFGCLSWYHDGGGSLRVRSGSIRQVCANTVSASEAEGAKHGTDFTFRHTKNVKERIADAKDAVKGAYGRRTLLAGSPAKASLTRTVRELVAA